MPRLRRVEGVGVEGGARGGEGLRGEVLGVERPSPLRVAVQQQARTTVYMGRLAKHRRETASQRPRTGVRTPGVAAILKQRALRPLRTHAPTHTTTAPSRRHGTTAGPLSGGPAACRSPTCSQLSVCASMCAASTAPSCVCCPAAPSSLHSSTPPAWLQGSMQRGSPCLRRSDSVETIPACRRARRRQPALDPEPWAPHTPLSLRLSDIHSTLSTLSTLRRLNLHTPVCLSQAKTALYRTLHLS